METIIFIGLIFIIGALMHFRSFLIVFKRSGKAFKKSKEILDRGDNSFYSFHAKEDCHGLSIYSGYIREINSLIREKLYDYIEQDPWSNQIIDEEVMAVISEIAYMKYATKISDKQIRWYKYVNKFARYWLNQSDKLDKRYPTRNEK